MIATFQRPSASPGLQCFRIAAGFLEMGLRQFLAGRESRQRGRGEGATDSVVLLNPVRQQASDVRERVAQGGEFPVEYSDDLSGRARRDDIAHVEVAVYQGHLRCQGTQR